MGWLHFRLGLAQDVRARRSQLAFWKASKEDAQERWLCMASRGGQGDALKPDQAELFKGGV